MKKRIVAIGGGTGLFTLLMGLKKLPDTDITAIVTMTDSGGSTGRLRDEFGYLPVGDIRQCIVALADDTRDLSLLRSLFLYRFAKGAEGLMGHSLGNLLLIALTDILGSETEAIYQISKILRLKGQVIPVTIDNVHLIAQYTNGEIVKGEGNIDEIPFEDRKIAHVSLEPECSVNPQAREALEHADFVILGPGDLYTSIVPNLLVHGVNDAIVKSKAPVAYVLNLFSKFGQTYGSQAKEHVSVIERYLRPAQLHKVLVNTDPMPTALVSFYKKHKELPVKDDLRNDPRIYRTSLLSTKRAHKQKGDILHRSVIRHDSDKLAAAIQEVFNENK